MATQGVSDTRAARALFELKKVANDTSKSLYDHNHAVYRLLRYGARARAAIMQAMSAIRPITAARSGWRWRKPSA